MELSFSPTIAADEVEQRLKTLLVCGPLDDPSLDRATARIGAAFRSYAASYPLPLWAPGLAVTQEMRTLSEALFPYRRVKSAFSLLVRKSCRFSPLVRFSALEGSSTWLDLLARTAPLFTCADPASTLRLLAGDERARRSFLFSLFLPRHYGGAFDRYPRQSDWISGWLARNRERLAGSIRALDCACGSGEGGYRLSELIVAAGYAASRSAVHGSTVEPFELFAAAHGYFPHDPKRQEGYRQRTAPLLTADAPPMEFYLDEVGSRGRGGYDLILCNGLLGGPLLHEEDTLQEAVAALASRLAPGGVLLAADRFHEGWKLKVPRETLVQALKESGLKPVEVPEGIGGVRCAQ